RGADYCPCRAGEWDRSGWGNSARTRSRPDRGGCSGVGTRIRTGKAAGLCREVRKWGPARGALARGEAGEATHPVSERALRPAVLERKGCFGSDSEAGNPSAKPLLPVAATCRQQGRSLLDFLVAAGDAALQAAATPSVLPTRPA